MPTRTPRLLIALALLGALGAPAAARAAEAPGPDRAGGRKLLSRIDFGNAYIMGQTIKSGAVYLLNRKQSEIPSMLRPREDFRREIREDAEVVDPAARGVLR